LRVCDKRTETGRREEATEGEREGAKAGTKRWGTRLGQLRLAGRRFPTHTLDLGLDATSHAFCRQWSGSSSTTSRNCSKKSIFSTYAPLSPSSFTAQNFFQWKQDANLREIKVMRRYHIQDREDYNK
jgi:hypothetical protein